MNYRLGYVFFLALVAALGGLLFGYDTAVISGTIEQVTEQFHLNSIMQGWYVGCALIGSIFGVTIAGMLSDRFGRRPTMLVSAVMFTVGAIGCAIAMSLTELVIYRIVGGIGIGVVSIVAPIYISEISITRYRGQMVSLYQLAVTIGFLTAYLVNYLLLTNSHTANYGTGL
ncbi:MAG: MFS transporter, partial [Prevotellaceae bacterium]|nr:MFS transporter [Prevotellaceae bacterium]